MFGRFRKKVLRGDDDLETTPNAVLNNDQMTVYSIDQLAYELKLPFSCLVLDGSGFKEEGNKAQNSEAAAALQAKHDLQKIQFSNVHLNNTLLNEMMEGLADNISVKEVTMSGCRLLPESLLLMGNILNGIQSLEGVTFMQNHFVGDALLDVFHGIRKAQKMDVVNTAILGHSHLLSTFAHPLSNIVTFSLKKVQFGKIIFANFCRALEGCLSIEELFFFSVDSVGDIQICQLAAALRKRSRQKCSPAEFVLKPSVCPYGDVGAFSIGGLLRDSIEVTSIGIRGSVMTDLGFKNLCAAAERHDNLKYISVRHLPTLTEDGWKAFARYVRSTNSLKDVWMTKLQNSRFSKPAVDALSLTPSINVRSRGS